MTSQLRRMCHLPAVCILACLLLVLSACGQSPANSAAPPAAPHRVTPTDTPARILGPPTPIPTPIPTATPKPLSLDEQIQRVTLTAVQQVTQGAHATVEVSDGDVTETE